MNHQSVNSLKSKIGSRLGKCEVCITQNAKYNCPKCEVKTCCLNCLKIHKKELNCSGIRDPTKFIPLKKITKQDFKNDYYFLEECTSYVENRKRDQIKKYTRCNKLLPRQLFHLRKAAKERKIKIKFLLDNFTKRKINTTTYDKKRKIIYWRIEWVFINAGNLKYVDEKCSENTKLSTLLDKYLNCNNLENVPFKKSLECYQFKKFENLKILLKAEGIAKCRNRYFDLDFRKTLNENLLGKTIVEFPTIYLICNDKIPSEFDIVDSFEILEWETTQYYKMMNRMSHKKHENEKSKIDKNTKVDLGEKYEENKNHKKLETKPINYLFSEYLSSDNSSEAEEEN